MQRKLHQKGFTKQMMKIVKPYRLNKFISEGDRIWGGIQTTWFRRICKFRKLGSCACTDTEVRSNNNLGGP